MEDAGNYTCLASNDVLTRSSPPAQLTVYVPKQQEVFIRSFRKTIDFTASSSFDFITFILEVDSVSSHFILSSSVVVFEQRMEESKLKSLPGQWSNWAAWSDCSAKCGRGIRTRTRTCNNPAPINNGPGCEGPPVEKKTCSSVCPKVDGKWSSWSSWSSCSPDCQQFRRRDCNNPKPDNGGRYCQGKDIASQNCTGGMCKPGLHSIVLYGTEPPTEVSDNASGVPVDVSLWIGLLVALVVFILAFLFIVKMMLRKKRLPASGYTLTTSGDFCLLFSEGGNPGSRMSKSGSTLGYAPDLTSGVQNEYNFTYSDKNSNSSIKSNSHGINGMSTPIPMAPFTEFRPISEHLYEQPMVPMQKASPDSHERAPFLPLDNASSASEQMTISAPSPSTSTTFSNSFSMPRNISAQHMNWATVTETGTRITVPKSTVTLTIPQGAVAPGRTQDIYVAVVAADRLKPRNQTLITPVVQWGGPIARNLLKPVVLSVPHVSKDNRRVMRALYCPDLEMDNAEWTVLNVDNNMQVDPSYVHLVTDKVGAYVMISENQHEIMSKTTKTALCRCLDVPTCQGNDWRKLAEVLGLNHYSMHFANQPSPSEAILNLWEARNNANDTKVALLKLEQLLKDINRLDAVVILQRELK
eukprot:09055.XXX_470797_475455_1 [CDS] Oithona nana genome sequencing.